MAKSIFKFGDKFGYESPFGDWLEERNQSLARIETIKVLPAIDIVEMNKGVIKNIKNGRGKIYWQQGYYKSFYGVITVPVYLHVTIVGEHRNLEINYEQNTLNPKPQQGFRTSRFTDYRYSMKISIPSSSNYKEVNCRVTLFDEDGKAIMTKLVTIGVFNDGKINTNIQTGKIKKEIEVETKCFCDGNLTIENIQNIAPTAKVSNIEKRLKGINEALQDSDINTCLRRVHFIAQVLHESTRLLDTRERNVPDSAYGGYPGRGLIQLTQSYNYKAYQRYSKVDITSSLSNKKKLETYPHASKSAVWFWSVEKRLNQYADENDLIMITVRLNGGLNHFDDRLKLTLNALKEAEKSCGGVYDKSFTFQKSLAKDDKRASFAWALWHDPDLDKIGCTKNKSNAIEGYKRFIEITDADFSKADWYGIRNMAEFRDIRYYEGSRAHVNVRKAAQLRLKKLQNTK